MTQPRQAPDYDKFVAGLDALRNFAEGVTRATAIRDAWRFAFTDDPIALERRLEGLDAETLHDLLGAAHRLATAVEIQVARNAEK